MTALRFLRILRPVPIPAAAPRFFSSSATARHGERFGEKTDDPGFKVDELKNASVQQQKQGKGEWVPALASDSEEYIKADKSAFDINTVKEKK